MTARRRAQLLFGIVVFIAVFLPHAAVGENKVKPVVVASFSIVGDLVQQVAGDAVTVVTIVGPNGDVHSFESTPRHSKVLREAQLLFTVGLGVEGWLPNLMQASKSKARIVVLSSGLDLMVAPQDQHLQSQDHHQPEYDPHVWHDVKLVQRMVLTIAQELAQLVPSKAELIAARSNAFQSELAALDTYIQTQTARLLPHERKLVTIHDTFGYFARRYGFEIIGSALGSLSSEASDPSAQSMAALIDRIKAERIPVLFVDTLSNPRILATIARSARVSIAPPLYTDSLGLPSTSGSTYLGMMRHNIDVIVSSLHKPSETPHPRPTN